jgi:aminoglycoside phosphotransferase (APT) family kinase protein
MEDLDALATDLSTGIPETQRHTVVHGDYRLDNTVLDPDDVGRIVAVLDWEMSTLGDPLTDLGLLLVYWGGEAQPSILAAQGVGAVPGFISRDEVVERYARGSGRSIDHLDFYVVFAMYKLAIIVEGINARYLMGKTLGEGFDQMGAMATRLIDLALEVSDSSAITALHG